MAMARTALWVARQWRLLRPGRNPLARRWERIEAGVLAVAIGMCIAAMPVATGLGSTIATREMPMVGQQAAEQSQSSAVTLGAAPPVQAGSRGAASMDREHVAARWTVPDGGARTGNIGVPAATAAGTTVPVWLDRNGNPAPEPVTANDVLARAVGIGLLVRLGCATTAAAAVVSARLVLGRFRGREWARDWEEFGRRWSRS
jgi:hypothetical protein